MRKKLLRAGRIVSTLDKMRIIEEVRLVESKRRLAESIADEERLVRFLSEGGLGDSELSRLLARRLDAVSVEVRAAEAGVKWQRESCRSQLMKHGQADRNARVLRIETAYRDRQADLSEVVDRSAGRMASSARQGADDKLVKS